jgi:hypothetical protein
MAHTDSLETSPEPAAQEQAVASSPLGFGLLPVGFSSPRQF